MRLYLSILMLAGCALFLETGHAGGMALKDRDCAEILKRWAADPGSVPQALVDSCREQLTAQAVPDIKPAAGKPQDPCAGADAAKSIHCWGPWAHLAPAGGGAVAPIVLASDDPNLRPDEFSDGPPPGSTPTPPLGSCAPGTACGFATIAPGLAAQPVDNTNTTVVPFDMDPGVDHFVVDPGGDQEVVSNDNLQRAPSLGPPRYEATVDGVESKLFVLQGTPATDGTYDRASGIWRHGSITDQTTDNTQAGVFAWGIASTLQTIDTLNAGNVTATFSGPMIGHTDTLASITVNFGSQPAWSGSWDNPGYSFTAGGPVQVVDLVSDPAQFSSNVASGYVQGALLGAAGSQSVAHTVDVILDTGAGNQLIVRDVGLLPQVPQVQ